MIFSNVRASLQKWSCSRAIQSGLETYEKIIDIEAKALSEIVNTQVLPVAYEYQTDLAHSLEMLKDMVETKTASLVDGALDDRKEEFEKITADIYYIRKNLKEMNAVLQKAHSMALEEKAAYFFSNLKPHMDHVRKHVDALEASMPDNVWQLPKYREMLFIK